MDTDDHERAEFKGLAAALSTIEKSIHAGEKTPPLLHLTEGEVSFAFATATSVEGGVEIVILELGAKASQAETHTLTLEVRASTRALMDGQVGPPFAGAGASTPRRVA